MAAELPDGVRAPLERRLGHPLPAQGGDRESLESLSEDDIDDLRLLRDAMIWAICHVRFRVTDIGIPSAMEFCERVVREGLSKGDALKSMRR